MAIINVANDFYTELETLGRSRGLTPEVLAHKLLSAGVQHMRKPAYGSIYTSHTVARLNRELTRIMDATGDIGNVREDLDTAISELDAIRNQLESERCAMMAYNELLEIEPGSTAGAKCMPPPPIEPPDPPPEPGPIPGPIFPPPERPRRRHCYECDKQEVCEIKAKMDQIVTHNMISLFDRHVDRIWKNVARACDAFWPLNIESDDHQIRPPQEVIGHIGEDGQMQPIQGHPIEGADELAKGRRERHTDAQSTVTGVRGSDHNYGGGTPGKPEGSR